MQSLYLIFSKSLIDGILLTKRKRLQLLLYTKKDRNRYNNYRPVSLTSVIVKMLETIIKDELMQYFKSENLLSICQHGFRSSHSCVTQLIQAVNDWSLVLESGNSHLRKALDCVPDGRLFTKLQSYGITGKLLKIF